jgi:hypothetical protein
MNREIKFRVWDISQVEYIDLSCGHHNVKLNTLISDSNFIFQQYTGIKDKNGREIYEGDYLKDFEFPIIFRDGCFFTGIAYDLTEVPLYELSIKEIEVIGNIFENPELNTNE